MATYTLISSNVLSSSAASVTFSSIPATYTDLVLRASIRSDRAVVTDGLSIAFDSTTAIYSYRSLVGNGSAASSAFDSSQASANGNTLDGASATSNTFASLEMYIPSYTVSQNKPFSIFSCTENNATAAEIDAMAYLYRSTSAISTIVIKSVTTAVNLVAGSSFYLYGISNA